MAVPLLRLSPILSATPPKKPSTPRPDSLFLRRGLLKNWRIALLRHWRLNSTAKRTHTHTHIHSRVGRKGRSHAHICAACSFIKESGLYHRITGEGVRSGLLWPPLIPRLPPTQLEETKKKAIPASEWTLCPWRSWGPTGLTENLFKMLKTVSTARISCWYRCTFKVVFGYWQKKRK